MSDVFLSTNVRTSERPVVPSHASHAALPRSLLVHQGSRGGGRGCRAFVLPSISDGRGAKEVVFRATGNHATEATSGSTDHGRRQHPAGRRGGVGQPVAFSSDDGGGNGGRAAPQDAEARPRMDLPPEAGVENNYFKPSIASCK
jgi:hypothetical protein